MWADEKKIIDGVKNLFTLTTELRILISDGAGETPGKAKQEVGQHASL